MLPMPPRTATAKTRPMYSRPMEGSTGPIMIISAPARLKQSSSMKSLIVCLAAVQTFGMGPPSPLRALKNHMPGG